MSKIKSLTLLIIIFVIFSCTKDDILKPKGNPENEVAATNSAWENFSKQELTSIYNSNLHLFAKSLSSALTDYELRKKIKKQALLMLDGDYDIIWKDFKNESIGDEKVLSKIISHDNSKTSNEKKHERLEHFNNLFKQFQISVPILIEKWNPESYIPLVAFRELTENGYTPYLLTYDSKGNVGRIEENQIPNMPIIVINLNERSDFEGNILNQFKKKSKIQESIEIYSQPSKIREVELEIELGISTPTNLNATFYNNFILLSWYLPIKNTSSNYEIEIQKEINGSFTKIATVSTYGEHDSYIDKSIFQNGQTYLYKVRAIEIDEFGRYNYSPWSPILGYTVNNALLPAPINVLATCIEPNNIKISWDYPFNSSITGFKIRKRRPLAGESFTGDAILIPYTSRFFVDTSPKTLGEQYEYEVIAYNSTTQSVPTTDITFNPFRSQSDNLYLTRIYFKNISEFESFDLGRPEVMVTLAHIQKEGGKPSIIYREERIAIVKTLKERISGNNTCEYAYDLNVLSGPWDPVFFKQILNFNFIEYDAPSWVTGWENVTFKVSVPIKLGSSEIKIEASSNLTFNTRKSNTEIGEAYYAYWSPKESRIEIQDDIIVFFSTESPNWK